jgi:hypothetical protein
MRQRTPADLPVSVLPQMARRCIDNETVPSPDLASTSHRLFHEKEVASPSKERIEGRGGESRASWDKQLYRKQPYPDNYVDQSFRAVLRKACKHIPLLTQLPYSTRLTAHFLPSDYFPLSRSNLSSCSRTPSSHHVRPRHLGSPLLDLSLHRSLHRALERSSSSRGPHLGDIARGLVRLRHLHLV